MEYLLKSAEETIDLGKKVGERLHGGELFLLEGDLGGGKTQFTKGLAKGLGVEETVISPTFTIERIYKADGLELHHFDFYRLAGEDPEMKEEISELLADKKNVVVIEWPQSLRFAMPSDYLEISFNYQSENERLLVFKAVGKDSKRLLENL